MKKFFILLVVVGLVMGISVYSLAWGGRGMGGGTRPGFPGPGNYQGPGGFYSAQQLELTDEQTARIEDLRDQLAEESEVIQEQLDEKRQAQHELYFSPDSSQEEIDAVQEEISELREQRIELRENFMLQLREVLTAEQLEKLADSETGLGIGFRMGSRTPRRADDQVGPGGRTGRNGYRNNRGSGFQGRGCYGAAGNYGMGRW